MHYELKNNTGNDFSILSNLIEKFFPYAKEHMGFDQPVTIVLESDLENAENPLGKTAYYSPSDNTVVLYTDNRHPKDLMRSLSHELVHHKQNCNGELSGITGEQGYAQTELGHKIEEEAYSLGNTCFRNWEDSVKKQINETSYITKEDGKMNLTKSQLREMIKESLKNVYLKEKDENTSNSTEDVQAEELNEQTEEECAQLKQDVEDLKKEKINLGHKVNKIEDVGSPADQRSPDYREAVDRIYDLAGEIRELTDTEQYKNCLEKVSELEELNEEKETKEEKKSLKNWWEESLYTKLVKKYTGGKNNGKS